MRNRAWLVGSLMVLGLYLPAVSPATTYKVDSEHTSVTFARFARPGGGGGRG